MKMTKAVFKFSEVESKNANPATTRVIITEVMRANDDACADEMERYLLPGGVSGSREYDHAYSVDVLLKHDALHGGRLATVMKATGLKRRMIWDELVKVYRNAGYQVKHGRIVGLIEDQSEKSGEGREDGIE